LGIGRAAAMVTLTLAAGAGATSAGPRTYDMTEALVLPPPAGLAEGGTGQARGLSAQARSEDRPATASGSGRILSELRVGIMHHDTAVFGHHKEEDVDVNFEALFFAPDFLRILFSPRPHLGVTYAPDDHTTSQVYFGLTWQYFFWGRAYVEGSFGGSYNDGSKDGSTTEKALGCHLLFRESVSLGYVFERRHALMATLDHISNGNLCDANDGLDTVGIRYGYRF
jgi:lipid A 3-O-deacylase